MSHIQTPNFPPPPPPPAPYSPRPRLISLLYLANSITPAAVHIAMLCCLFDLFACRILLRVIRPKNSKSNYAANSRGGATRRHGLTLESISLPEDDPFRILESRNCAQCSPDRLPAKWIKHYPTYLTRNDSSRVDAPRYSGHPFHLDAPKMQSNKIKRWKKDNQYFCFAIESHWRRFEHTRNE